MLIFKVQIYIRSRQQPCIGHWKTIGFIRSPVYSRRSALDMVESIPELWQMVQGHAIEFEVSRWDSTHRKGNSIVSWSRRCRKQC